MSREATTQLLGLPRKHVVPDKCTEAFSAAEVDQRSASRMLRVLILFAWALAGAVLVSALFGYGTDFSNVLAGGWFAVFSVLLLAWPRMNLFWHRGIAVVILMLIVIRWSVSWLYAEPADAMSIHELKHEDRTGAEVTVVGRIGGRGRRAPTGGQDSPGC